MTTAPCSKIDIGGGFTAGSGERGQCSHQTASLPYRYRLHHSYYLASASHGHGAHCLATAGTQLHDQFATGLGVRASFQQPRRHQTFDHSADRGRLQFPCNTTMVRGVPLNALAIGPARPVTASFRQRTRRNRSSRTTRAFDWTASGRRRPSAEQAHIGRRMDICHQPLPVGPLFRVRSGSRCAHSRMA